MCWNYAILFIYLFIYLCAGLAAVKAPQFFGEFTSELKAKPQTMRL